MAEGKLMVLIQIYSCVVLKWVFRKKMVRKVNMVEPHPITDNNFRMVIRAKNVAWVVQSYQQVFSPRLLLSRLEESTRQEY